MNKLYTINDNSIDLHQVSVPVIVENATPVIENLIKEIPQDALGLSAPQIGIFDRIFITRLSDGFFAFVNPSFKLMTQYQFVANEGCLSIPDTVKMISRYQDIKIEASAIYSIENKEYLSLLPEFNKELHQGDAAIFQHEFDHLEGILITDHSENKTPKSIIEMTSTSPFLQESTLRETIIRTNRRKKANETKKNKQKIIRSFKMNPKKHAKLIKQLKLAEKYRQKRIKVEEYQKAIKTGLINNE